MKHCDICGKTSGIYDLCGACQEQKNQGHIKYCGHCNKYYYSQNKCQCEKAKSKKAFIITIVAVILIIAMILPVTIIYLNIYDISISYKDFYEESEIKNGKLIITITPKINIKNFEFSFFIHSQNEKIKIMEIPCEIELAKKGKHYRYEYSIRELETGLYDTKFSHYEFRLYGGKVKNIWAKRYHFLSY